MKENPKAELLKIAIPVVDGRLHGHFAGAAHFALVEADRPTRDVGRSQIAAPPPHEPGSIPRWLREQGVQVLIVGSNGIGRRALDNLVYHGIEVFTGQPGTPVAALVAACLEGQLPRTREGCDHQHDPNAKAQGCRLAGYFSDQ